MPDTTPARRPRPDLDLAKRLLGRVRWVNKARTVRDSGASPLRHARHVLTSPELESFSYELADPRDVARQVAELLGTPLDVQLGHLAELEAEPELHGRLRRATRWRWTVRTGPRPGNRVAWYLVVRTQRPEVVVETGIYDGLGSLVLLCALARNAAEGHPGELVSVDPDPRSGSLVPERLRGAWTVVRGTSAEDLEPVVAGRRVGVLFSDSPHTRVNQEAEFAIARRHAAPELVLVDGSGWLPVLGEVAEEEGVELRALRFVSRRHFYDGGATALVLRRP